MESPVSNELLYFFYLTISSGLIESNDYVEKLNQLFLVDAGKSEILLDLEYCTGDPEKTITTIKTALYDKTGQIDFQNVGKMLFDELRRQYSEDCDCLKEISQKLYVI